MVLIYMLLSSALLYGTGNKPEHYGKIGKSALSSTTGKKELVTPKTDRGTTYITLEVRGKDIPIAQEVARNPLISILLATSLENDKDATEIPIPSERITPEIMTTVKEMLVRIHGMLNKAELAGDVKYADITPARKKQFTDKALSILGRVKDAELSGLISAVHYLDAPILLDVLLWHYSSLIKAALDKEAKAQEARDQKGGVERYQDSLKRKAGIVAGVLKANPVFKEFLPLLSRQYFLRYAQDIDELFGIKRQYIPVETLRSYGLLGEDFSKNYPNLQGDPNAKMPMSDGLDRTALSYAISSTQPRAVNALFKIKGIDVNMPQDNPPLLEAAEEVNRLLKRFYTSPMPPFVQDIVSGSVVRALLAQGANMYARGGWRHENVLQFAPLGVMKILAEFGMFLDAPINQNFETALIRAVEASDIPMIRWLLSQPDVDVNAPYIFFGDQIRTPLYLAKKIGNKEVIAMIVAAGGKVKSRRIYIELYKDALARISANGRPWEVQQHMRALVLKNYEKEMKQERSQAK